MIRGWWDTTTGVLFPPRAFFDTAARSPSAWPGITGALVTAGIARLPGDLRSIAESRRPSTGVARATIVWTLGSLVVGALPLLSAGIAHATLRLFGGARRPLASTARVFAYGQACQLLLLLLFPFRYSIGLGLLPVLAIGMLYASSGLQKHGQLVAALAQSTEDLITGRTALVLARGVYAKNVEASVDTSAGMAACGVEEATRRAPSVPSPDRIDVKYDRGKGLIDVYVFYNGGARRCDVEISSDGTNRVRVGGDGVERKLSGYAPGTWWIRARTKTAASDGPWFGPVSVNVK